VDNTDGKCRTNGRNVCNILREDERLAIRWKDNIKNIFKRTSKIGGGARFCLNK
jgi:hypothetical protein